MVGDFDQSSLYMYVYIKIACWSLLKITKKQKSWERIKNKEKERGEGKGENRVEEIFEVIMSKNSSKLIINTKWQIQQKTSNMILKKYIQTKINKDGRK
jgi:dGTP triphosphohydrolase